MKKVICLVITIILVFSISTNAEKASVRGVQYGMSYQEIIAIEETRNNKEYTLGTGYLEYENLKLAGIDATVSYSQFPTGNPKIMVKFPEYRSTTSDQFINGSSHKRQMYNSALSVFNTIEAQLLNNYGEFIATSEYSTKTVLSTDLFEEYYQGKNVVKEYGPSLLDYREWLIEYDDCWLAIDLYIINAVSLAGDNYKCTLAYQMFDKASVNIGNERTESGGKNNDF